MLEKARRQIMIVISKGEKELDTKIANRLEDLRDVMNEAVSRGCTITIVPVKTKPSKRKKQ